MGQVRRALLSVFDKDGVEDLARELQRREVEILSSGGTAKHLEDRGIAVRAVSEYTGSPEILGGRVKTLHPRICGGILARDTPQHRSELAQQEIGFIDLVVVNLYPFEQTIARPAVSGAEVIEMIDIGGPTLVRAAAKNHDRVAVVVDPADYRLLIEDLERNDGQVSAALRRRLAYKAFAHTAHYDAAIAAHLGRELDEPLPEAFDLPLARVQSLRYGENPHQRAALYRSPRLRAAPAIVDCAQLQGKELSYNNILDADAALGAVLDLRGTAVCVVKHTNPCGAATGPDVAEAFRRARATDPVSAFGGIVSCNQPVTEAMALELKEIFLEAVVAPGFEAAAIDILKRKKKLRLLRYTPAPARTAGLAVRSVSGGLLVQDADMAVEDISAAQVVTTRQPTADELQALDFAWRICKHVKSNAIVFANHQQLVGVGAGQMSRVDSVRLAATKAQLPLAGTVLASDAFFPFRDGVDAAREAGATAVIQPGGSIRDEEVIAAANEHGMAMVFTGARHFRH